MQKRIVFNNPQFQSFFEENGYIKIKFLEEPEIEKCLSFIQNHDIDFPEGFSSTVAFTNILQKQKIHEFLSEIINSKIDNFFNNYLCTITAFICKKKYTNKLLDFHQDWSFIDESLGLSSINVWCPLQTTNQLNGGISIIKKSHLLPRYPRANPTNICIDNKYLIGNTENIVKLDTELGEAVIFDNATYHSTCANTTNTNRLVVGTMLTPVEAQLLMYYHNTTQENLFDVFETTKEFFIYDNPFLNKPSIYLGTTTSDINVQQATNNYLKQYGIKSEQTHKRHWWKFLN